MGRGMKNKIKQLFTILVVTAGCLMFASFSPSLDGRAVVVEKGVFPQGLFAKTVGYLPGDIISVTNIAGDTTIDLLVIGALDPSEGVAIMLSPEAADAMGIDKGANNIVKITKRSGQDERVYGNAVISKSSAEINDFDDGTFENISAEENTEAFEEAPVEEAAVLDDEDFEEAEEEESEPEVEEETEAEEEEAEAEEDFAEEEEESFEDEEALEEEAFEDEEAEDTEEAVEEDFEEEAAEEEAEEPEAESEAIEEEAPEELEEAAEEEAFDDEEPDALPAEEEFEEEAEEAPEESEDLEEESLEESDIPEEEGFDEEAFDAEKPEDLPAEEEETEEPEEEAPAEEAFEADELDELESEEAAAEPEPEEAPAEESYEEDADEYEAIVLVPVDSNPPESSDSDEVEDVISDTGIDNIDEVEEEVLAPINTNINSSVSNNTGITPVETKPAEGNVTSYDKYMVPSLKDLESGKYYIQIAVYGSDENILDVINKYGNNYPITIVPMAGGKTKQVLVGPVTMDEYKVVLERFKSYGFKDSFLRKVK